MSLQKPSQTNYHGRKPLSDPDGCSPIDNTGGMLTAGAYQPSGQCREILRALRALRIDFVAYKRDKI
jgi:hypothetical protein